MSIITIVLRKTIADKTEAETLVNSVTAALSDVLSDETVTVQSQYQENL